MRIVVVGLGVQGEKRLQVAGSDAVATADPKKPDAKFALLNDLAADEFDAALLCVPDAEKLPLLRYLAEKGKHALIEKPLLGTERELLELQDLARGNSAVFYTAYNHRFEPHFVRMRDLIASGELGEIYRCRMFYGNGTARLVRESQWRDAGSGVLGDLGSHLLDTLEFWYGQDALHGMRVISSKSFENAAPDHVVIGSSASKPVCELEMTLLMWRNHFTCDVLAENGSAHISSLCKWGPSTFTVRRRVLPSGRPPEESITLVQSDPTWEAEYAHFKQLIASSAQTDLSRDMTINAMLAQLGDQAVRAG